MGGEITWECLNNGSYVFTLKVYRDCNGVNFAVTNHALQVHNFPNTGMISQIPLTFFSVDDITPSCEGSVCATLSPSDPDIPGAIEEYILKSAPVVLNGVPGANGWIFTWTYGNRNAAIDNMVNAQNFGITLRAKMFSYFGRNANTCFDSSPDFFQKPSTIICTGEKFTYNHSAYDNELDSLSYSWAEPLDGNFCTNRPCLLGGLFQENNFPAMVPFDVADGYAFDKPFPDTTFDSRNEQAVLNHETGEITFTSFNSGEFVSVIRVSAYKCGIKVAEVYRELQTVITSGCASNEPPIIPSPLANGTFSDTVKAGEFIEFDIRVFDTLRLDNPKDDSIFFYASGLQFGTNFTDSLTGCLNPPCATLSRPAPDTGFGVFTTKFRWQTTCNHLVNSTPSCITSQNSYLFVIRAFDDFCPAAGQTIASFNLIILEEERVRNPEIYCADVQPNGDVRISWNRPPDPDSSFNYWMIYSALDRNGPYQLIDSLDDYFTTSYLHAGAGANDQSIHYIVRTRSGCHSNWFFLPTDTVSSINIEPTFNDTCVNVSWNPLSNPSPDSSATTYDIYREYPIGSGFALYKSTSATSFCDTFSVCTDSVTYRIELGNSSSICSESSSNIKGIRFQYPLPVVDAGDTFNICTGQSIVIGGSPTSFVGNSFLWTPNDRIDFDTIPNPRANPLSSINYILTVTDSINCMSSDTAFVIVEPSPISNAGNNDTICVQSLPYQLNGTVSVTNSGRWESGTGNFNPDRNTLNATYFPSTTEIANGSVTLQLVSTNNGICDTDTNEIKLFLPTFAAGINLQLEHVTCNGLSDGTAKINISSGNPPFDFSWNTNNGIQTGDTISGLIAGTYDLTISNLFGCDTVLFFTITEPAVLSTTTSVFTDVSCFGLSNGQAIVTASGGSLPYTYFWSNSQTSDTAISLSSGTYTVTVTDDNSCSEVNTIFINEPQVLQSTIASSSNVSCFGFNDGQAIVSGQGGTQPYSYLWSDNQTSDTAFNLIAGNYQVTITDFNNCTDTTNVTITEPAILSLSINSENLTCFQNNSGSAKAIVSGGTSPYTYLWSNNESIDSIQNLAAGVYRVTVTDLNNCTLIDSVTIIEPTILSSNTFTIDNVSCFGLNDGQGLVIPSGGTTPYNYIWSNSHTGDTISNLAVGTYTVTVSDANSCSLIDSIIILEPTVLSISTTVSSNTSCNGLSDGKAVVTATGGTAPYSYFWNNNQISDTATSLAAGTYLVTVTDVNSCSQIDSVTITEPLTLQASIASGTNVSCNGFNDGRAVVSGQGGTLPYSYLWNDNQIADTALNLVAGNYRVTITDANNCSDTTSISITEPAVLSSIVSSTNLACFEDNGGSANILASGGTSPYSYNWSTNETTDSIQSLSAGIYRVTLTDANNCVLIDSINITEPTLLTNINTVLSDVSCNGRNDGIAVSTPSGGTAPYNFLWSNIQVTDTISNLLAGTYTVTISDANNCTLIDTVTISEPVALSISTSMEASVTCSGLNNGQAIVSANGGTLPYSYLWNNNQTSDTASSLSAGTYTVTVTDANSCSIVDSVTITEPLQLQASIASGRSVSCDGFSDGQAIAAGQGGTLPYAYLWSNNQVGDTAFNLSAGNYRVTITDSNNCVAISTISILEPDLFSISLFDEAITCNGFDNGSIKVRHFGGTSPVNYTWNTNQTGDSLVNLAPGNYGVTATDANGCLDSSSFILTEPDSISLSITASDTICINTFIEIRATASGGVGNYSFTWDDNLGNDSVLFLSPPENTLYTVSVTDANNCPVQEASTFIAVRDIFKHQINLSSSGNICRGDSSLLTYTFNGDFPPYTFIWGQNLPNTNPQYVSPQSSTTYRVAVYDACNNTISDTALVQVSDPPEININDITLEDCQVFSVTFNNNTSIDYIYNWNFGDGNSSTLPNPTHAYETPGTYRVNLKVTTQEGCSSEFDGNYLVIVRPRPEAQIFTDRTIADISDPVIRFSGDFSDAQSWIWNFGNTQTSTQEEETISYPDTGTYRVQLIETNQFNCSDTAFEIIRINPNFTIKIPNAFTPDPNGSNGGAYNKNNPNNTVFHPFLEYVEQYRLMIFNRWGELIFESKDVNIGWDGYYRGSLSQSDVYVYKLEVRFIDGQEVTKVGDITLLR
tara:strand:- start:4932 stop:11306 length:6375 start_codon:yes stop_codon:yes gene_type:complete